jgi:Ca-activated chloride channel homolog
MLAALLWPLDVAVRRLQLPDQWWLRLGAIWKGKRTKQGTSASNPDAVWTRMEEKRAKRRTSTRSQTPDIPSIMVEQSDKPSPARNSTAASKRTESSRVSESQEQNQASEPEVKSDETINRLLAAKNRRNK